MFLDGLTAALTALGEQPAIRTGDGQVLSGLQVRDTIFKLAHGLAAEGLGEGRRVVVLTDNRDLALFLEIAAAFLGAQIVMGGVADAFLAQGGTIDRAVVFAGQDSRGIAPVRFAQEWLAGSAEPIAPRPFTMFFGTSGSTGLPKFVSGGQAAVGYSVDLIARNVGRGSGNRLLTVPLSSSWGLAFVCASWACGQGVMGTAGDVTATLSAARAFGVGEAMVTPMILGDLVERAESGQAVPAFARLITGGAAADPGLIARARAALSGVTVAVASGMTEIGAVAFGDTDPTTAVIAGWAGRIYPGVELSLRDKGNFPGFGPDAGRLAGRMPPGARFEGYFGSTSFLDADGWYETNDIATITPRGELIIHGRQDFLINLGGAKYAPELIEMLCAGMAGITAAAATARSGTAHGGLGLLVVAGPNYDEALLRQVLLSRLGVSADLAIRVVPALPRLGNGKLDRAAVARGFG